MRLQKIPDSDPEFPYEYRMYDHCIQIDILGKWANETEFNCKAYSNVVYFMSEKDATMFMLRWS